jgi:phage shock protein E
MGFFGNLVNAISGSGSESIPDNAIFIDVRSPGEAAGGTIDGAINIPLPDIGAKAKGALPKEATPIVVFCASGMRSGMAKKTLQSLGYEQVTNGGGIGSLAIRLGKRIV